MIYAPTTPLFNLLRVLDGYLEKGGGGNLGDFTPKGKHAFAGMNNYTLYAVWYKRIAGFSLQANPYCAMGVSTAFAFCYGKELGAKLLGGKYFHYCPDGVARFKNYNGTGKSRLFNTPEPGDVVFFNSSGLGRWSHTGIVIAVNKTANTYTTGEMNTSSAAGVERNGGATRIKKYAIPTDPKKVIFGRPDYSMVPESTLMSDHLWKQRLQISIGADPDGEVGSDTKKKLPILSRSNNTMEVIRNVQERLLMLGYDPNGLDGQWGSGLEAAIMKFKTAFVGKSDPVVDTDTWNVLISPKPIALEPKGFVKANDGAWYYYTGGPNSMVKDAWQIDNGTWYRLDVDGKMMEEKWYQDGNGKWYYLHKGGAMAHDAWLELDAWYYAQSNGDIITEKRAQIGDAFYSFDKNGRMEVADEKGALSPKMLTK